MTKATKAMINSWLNAFVAAIITAAIAVFSSNGGSLPLDGKTWLGVLVAGVVAVLPVIKNYFDKNYSLYGKGSVQG
jgi:uncharacterized membrane protein